ncbi:unnamed protein product [Lampetra planeri]
MSQRPWRQRQRQQRWESGAGERASGADRVSGRATIACSPGSPQACGALFLPALSGLGTVTRHAHSSPNARDPSAVDRRHGRALRRVRRSGGSGGTTPAHGGVARGGFVRCARAAGA